MPGRNNILAGNILPSAGFTPAVFQGNTFTPQQADTSLLARSLDKIEQRELATSQQRGAIAKALADVELNEAEDAWKANYANRIQDEINGLIAVGDYSNALNRSAILAGKALADPALRGRVRAQQEYKKKRDEVLARTDLNQVTKDRWLEQNPYHYEDKFDTNGNVVGGTSWSSSWNPVSRYDMTKLYGLAQQLAAKEAGGGESAQFLDENGNLTSNPEKGFFGMAVKRGTKWERLPVEKLQKVFNSLFAQAPEAMDALMQDMDDRRWQFDKLDNEGKKAFIGSDIMDEKGVLRTPEEYLAHRVNPILSSMAYSHSWSTIDYGQAYSNRQKYLKDQQAKVELLNLERLENTTMTMPIEVDLSERAGQSYASVMNALSDINSLWKNTPQVLNSKQYKDMIAKRDYNGIADYLTRNITTKDPQKAADARAAIRLLKSEGNVFKSYINGMQDADREAIEFSAAMESGAPLPNAANNRYTRAYNDKFNKAFTASVPGTGQRKTAAKVGLEFKDQSQENRVIEYLSKHGIDRQDFKKYGIEITTNSRGKAELRIAKNSPKHRDIADAFVNSGGFYTNLYKEQNTINGRTYALYDSNNNAIPYIGTSGNFAANYFQIGNNASIAREAKSTSERAFTNNPNLKSVMPLQVLPNDDFNTMKVNELWLNGTIDRADRNEIVKNFNANNLKALGSALEHPNNYAVYGRVEENGNAVKLNQKKVTEVSKEILAALADDRVEISPASPNTGKGYGTIVRIKPKVDSKGNTVIEGSQYYFDGLYDGPAGKAYAATPDAIYNHEFQSLRAINAPITDVLGRQINYYSPNASKEYIAAKKMDEVYEAVNQIKDAGGTISRKDAEDTVTERLIEAGYVPGSNEFKERFSILVSKLEK